MSRKEQADEKLTELSAMIKKALSAYDAEQTDQLVKNICDNFIRVSPPEEPPHTIGLITTGAGGIGGGRSAKPGNIVLDLKKLSVAVASGVINVTAVVDHPFLAPFAALALWDNIWSCANVELSEREASVIWTMWLKTNDDNTIPAKVDVIEVQKELRQLKHFEKLLPAKDTQVFGDYFGSQDGFDVLIDPQISDRDFFSSPFPRELFRRLEKKGILESFWDKYDACFFLTQKGKYYRLFLQNKGLI